MSGLKLVDSRKGQVPERTPNGLDLLKFIQPLFKKGLIDSAQMGVPFQQGIQLHKALRIFTGRFSFPKAGSRTAWDKRDCALEINGLTKTIFLDAVMAL